MMNLEQCWFISDPHFNHSYINKAGEKRGVIYFERTKFKDIAAHDHFIHIHLLEWAKDHKGQTLFVLGDFGDVNYLYIIDELRYSYNITVNFVWGNHDKNCDKELFEEHFDNVYYYPTYIADRVILSHEPVYPCPDGCVNVHGHLHGAKLASSQHICASMHVVGYKPFSGKVVAKTLSKIPKASYKFLEEPYAHLYQFTQEKEDVVYNKKTGLIDINWLQNKKGK